MHQIRSCLHLHEHECDRDVCDACVRYAHDHAIKRTSVAMLQIICLTAPESVTRKFDRVFIL